MSSCGLKAQELPFDERRTELQDGRCVSITLLAYRITLPEDSGSVVNYCVRVVLLSTKGEIERLAEEPLAGDRAVDTYLKGLQTLAVVLGVAYLNLPAINPLTGAPAPLPNV